ncbi:MAG: fumarate hydratase [Kiritimatiellae bacterium]|nr:fumarate hydratase [Kiritimatiellia bacterium]
MNTVEKLAGLIRETSSSLPEDVESALAKAKRREQGGSSASVVLGTVLDNVRLARKLGAPLCQDTGTLAFYIDASLRRKVSPAVVKKAVALATTRGYLRKNCIDSVTGKSYDDNCADGAPVIHYVDWQKPGCVTLLMKGGGSENMSRQYSLPDSTLGAGRDIAGVRKCILDAVVKAQGFGCAPGILGVCIGGDRATAYEVAKEQLLRSLDASGESSDSVLRRLEKSILRESNSLGIGPMGLGGKTTLLGVRIASRPRVPASFFVTVAYMCWACRRGSLKFKV